jgi:Domain of unknown function (DUF4803)
MQGKLENINPMIREKHVGGFGESFVFVIINYLNSLPNSKHCGTITGPRHILYHLFILLIETEMRAYYLLHTGYLLMQYLSTGKLLNWPPPGHSFWFVIPADCYNGEKRMMNATFESHMANILENVGDHFSLLSKFTYNCPPEQYVEGVNYARLAGVQPMYIYNIRDIHPFHYYCDRCQPAKTYDVRRHVSDVAKKVKKECSGKLKECQPLAAEFTSLCIAKNVSINLRYGTFQVKPAKGGTMDPRISTKFFSRILLLIWSRGSEHQNSRKKNVEEVFSFWLKIRGAQTQSNLYFKLIGESVKKIW